MSTLFFRSRPRAILSVAAVLMLGACEIRDTAGEDAQTPLEEEAGAPQEGTAPPATEPTDAETPAASIIREDVAAEQEPEEPPVPFEIVLPFPDSAQISPSTEKLLESVLASEALAQGWPVTLGGHTDSGGNDQANLRASRSRAEAVAAWLVERGVADERITVIAFGEQNPIAPNARPDGTSNEQGRRTNRRVELRIAPRATPTASPTPANATGAKGA